MTFYGKQPDAPKSEPLRTWNYLDSGGEQQSVAATYVGFMPEHVSFWIATDGDWDTLVLAEANSDVRHLREVARNGG